jgi:hypothetical protein
MYGTPQPGRISSSSSSSITEFKSLTAANEYAGEFWQELWQQLQEHPPYACGAVDKEEDEENVDEEFEEMQHKTVLAEGRAKWQRQQWFHHKPFAQVMGNLVG